MSILAESIKQTNAVENTANNKATNVRLKGPNVPAPSTPQSSESMLQIR
jgi:hypothetical protein